MSSPVIAGGLGECCFTAVKHSGAPAGSVVPLGGVDTYVSTPPAHARNGHVVLFLPDIYGALFLNNQLLQDYFAAAGFVVAGPEYFFGDLILDHKEEGFDRDAWVATAKKRAADALPAWLDTVKAKFGTPSTKYFAVGYCFGAPLVMNLGATEAITAGAIAHPAFLDEDHFQNIKVPLLLSCAEVDHTFPVERRRRAEDILVARKATYYFQVFSGVAHGFAVRADIAVPHNRWAKEESARGVAAWFDFYGKV